VVKIVQKWLGQILLCLMIFANRNFELKLLLTVIYYIIMLRIQFRDRENNVNINVTNKDDL
jgi:hypothetical protein